MKLACLFKYFFCIYKNPNLSIMTLLLDQSQEVLFVCTYRSWQRRQQCHHLCHDHLQWRAFHRKTCLTMVQNPASELQSWSNYWTNQPSLTCQCCFCSILTRIPVYAYIQIINVMFYGVFLSQLFRCCEAESSKIWGWVRRKSARLQSNGWVEELLFWYKSCKNKMHSEGLNSIHFNFVRQHAEETYC